MLAAAEQIARSAAWWADHGQDVRQSSVASQREHNGKMVWDFAYRKREKLGEKMAWNYARNLGLADGAAPSRSVPIRFIPGGEMTDLGDRMASVQNNDGLGFADYLPPYETRKNEWFQRTAEEQFKEQVQAETGMQLSDVEFKKLRLKTRETMRQSALIADKLERAGEAKINRIKEASGGGFALFSAQEYADLLENTRKRYDVYRHDGYNLFIWWIHSKTLEKMPAYRRICLLPYVAAMTRAPKLAALEFFLQEHPYCRFWTFTTGKRCVAKEIPARLDWLFYKLRELNREIGSRWGLQIIFRTTEFGTLEADEKGNRVEGSLIGLNAVGDGAVLREEPGSIEKDANGSALFHPHAHCVIHSARGYIQPAKWTACINFIHGFWRRDGEKVLWLADGVIRDARECCKYVTKPGDILKLSDSDLADFFEATSNRRLVRPMGILAREIADRKGLRILRRKRINGKMKWVEALNHNRLTSESNEEKEARENLQDAIEFKEECQHLYLCTAPDYPGGPNGGIPRAVDRSVDATKILARVGPSAGPTAFKEPRVIIMTNREKPDMRTVNAHPLVSRLWCDSIEQWEAGKILASAINVHTGTLSVEELPELREFTADLPGIDPPPDAIFHHETSLQSL